MSDIKENDKKEGLSPKNEEHELNGEFDSCAGYKILKSKINGNYSQDKMFRDFTAERLKSLNYNQSLLSNQIDKVQKTVQDFESKKIELKNGQIHLKTRDEALRDIWERLYKQEQSNQVWTDISNAWTHSSNIWKKYKKWVIILMVPMIYWFSRIIYHLLNDIGLIKWVKEAGFFKWIWSFFTKSVF